jgi:UDP-N-acetylglucosamine 2-epimerase (non-hydrolysing)
MPQSVHLIIGTKAQFIKMVPLAFLMHEKRVPYRIIDLSQHGALTGQIVADFGLKPDIRYLYPTGANVSSYAAALAWTAGCAARLARPADKLRAELLLDQRPSSALVHGDTLSTLLGMFLAKRLGLPTGLVEAGLTSDRLLSPFPEEAIRRHVESRVEYLFADSDTSVANLKKRGVSGKIVNTRYNTGRDAFLLTASRLEQTDPIEPYTVLTLHRSETLTRKSRLRTMIEHVLRLADRLPAIRFFVHEPTLRALRRADLIERIRRHPRIEMTPLASYPEFVRTLVLARFILTDGGSIQEEASYLRKPCLVLRRETERGHGIGTTARLTAFDIDDDVRFLESVPLEGKPALKPTLEASRSVLQQLGVPI